ncbi:AI-2E family transporter [uncultured Arenimonas sp.]|uniref:AI-2E family transporter n=1 Tax=uncultured Arenimonas sp. TaxID=546226 RepID=UPI0030D7C170
MNTRPMSNPFSDRRPWQWLAVLVFLGVLIWLLGPVLTPFVISALLAWLGGPLVRKIESTGRSRTAAVLLVFTLMSLGLILGVLLLIPLIESQVSKFIDWLPRFGQWLTGTAVPWAEDRFKIDLAGYVDPSQLIELFKQHWKQAGGIAASMMGEISKSGMALVNLLVNLALIPVVTFFFMRDGPEMMARARELLPRPIEPTVVKLAHESDQMLGGFIRGQLTVMIALGVIYGVGLTAVGVDLGILIGLVAGLVAFVPYLGAIVGLGAAVIATLVQHGDLLHLALVLGVFGLGQLLESFWLTPWLVGDKIGLHPVAVIFAVMAGGQLFGFLGVLLALPIAAVAVVLGRYVYAQYTQSELYGADDESGVIVAGRDPVGGTSVPNETGTEVPPSKEP